MSAFIVTSSMTSKGFQGANSLIWFSFADYVDGFMLRKELYLRYVAKIDKCLIQLI